MTCTDCGKDKPIVSEEYYKDGVSKRCSECFEKHELNRALGWKDKEEKPKEKLKDSIKGKFKHTSPIDEQ